MGGESGIQAQVGLTPVNFFPVSYTMSLYQIGFLPKIQADQHYNLNVARSFPFISQEVGVASLSGVIHTCVQLG